MSGRYRRWDHGESWCTDCAAIVASGATGLHDAFHDRIDGLTDDVKSDPTAVVNHFDEVITVDTAKWDEATAKLAETLAKRQLIPLWDNSPATFDNATPFRFSTRVECVHQFQVFDQIDGGQHSKCILCGFKEPADPPCPFPMGAKVRGYSSGTQWGTVTGWQFYPAWQRWFVRVESGALDDEGEPHYSLHYPSELELIPEDPEPLKCGVCGDPVGFSRVYPDSVLHVNVFYPGEAHGAILTSLSGTAAVRTSEPEPPTSVAPAGEEHGAPDEPGKRLTYEQGYRNGVEVGQRDERARIRARVEAWAARSTYGIKAWDSLFAAIDEIES